MPERLAAVREGDDDAVAAADEAVQLVLGLGEAARRDRGPLRLERRTAAPAGSGSSSDAPSQRDRRRAPPPPRRARTSSGCQTRSGARSSGRDEVVRARRPARPRPVVVGRACGSTSVALPLRGRVDDRVLDRVERALRERREGAHLLDLVAEELDAERLAAGGREDVDDAAAHGELAALLDALDPLVAGERERLGEPVDARLLADGQSGPAPGARRRRHPLRERRRRGADEAAGGEHVERPGPLADEVRRRLEPADAADATAREQRDAVGPEEPARPPRRRRARRRPRAGARGARDPSRAARAASRARSGSTGSETRARAGSAAANDCSRSLASSSRTKRWRGGRSMARGGNRVSAGDQSTEGRLRPRRRSARARARSGAGRAPRAPRRLRGRGRARRRRTQW